jgi:hypothetical protein
MASYVARKKSTGDIVEKEISAVFVGFIAAVCQWFQIKPEGLKRPGTRPNSPPPSGGFSALG